MREELCSKTRANYKGDQCSPLTSSKLLLFLHRSHCCLFSPHNLLFPSFFQIHFFPLQSTLTETGKCFPSPQSTNPPPRPTVPPEHQYTTRPSGPNRRKAEENSATPIHNGFFFLSLSFIRFLRGDAVKAPLAQNKRFGKGREAETGRGISTGRNRTAARDSKQCQ